MNVMNVKITFKGGPLDGTYSFPNFSPDVQPLGDDAALNAWAHYLACGDAVGKSSVGLSPGMRRVLQSQGPEAAKAAGASGHKYVTTERKVDGENVSVVVTYRPKDK
jgi:hypothetical protein